MSTKFSQIVWRAYLTLLAILTTATLLAILVDSKRCIEEWNNRKILTRYYEQHFGKFQPNKPDTLGGSEDWIPLPIPPTKAKNVDWDAWGKYEKNCVWTVLFFSEYIQKWCPEGSWDILFSPVGLNAYSQIGPRFNFLNTYLGLSALAILLILRYWIIWMVSGRRPHSFP